MDARPTDLAGQVRQPRCKGEQQPGRGQREGRERSQRPKPPGGQQSDGVLRRALLVYTEAVRRMRNGSAPLPAEALARTARLFRSFGEDYHERTLGEQYIFPRASRLKGEAARLPEILKAQHERGRAITDYVPAVTGHGAVASANAAPLARTLDSFVLMYQHHTALEDTVLFPAWKQALPDGEYHELSERFEELEHKMFGKERSRLALIGFAVIMQLASLPPFVMARRRERMRR